MTTRIAVIADIHGNLPAFQAILNDLEIRQADRVIIAGDIITDCPDSDEVLSIIHNKDWTVIKGNREQYYLDHRAGLLEHWTHARQMSALMWTFDRLSHRNRRYMEKLKEQTTLSIQELQIKVVHGSPDSISELLFPVEEKDRFEDLMAELEEDILICGHSHRQWFVQVGEKWALNPGAAGVHFNAAGGAEYALLTIEENIPSAELIQIPYSLEQLDRRFHDSGLYSASPHWSQSIMDSIRKGENISLKMIAYALEIMEQEGITDALTIPDHIWDRAGEEYLNPG